MNVLFIAAEADPLVKKGGLGDVAGSLPIALKKANPKLDVRLAIPHYQSLNTNYPISYLLSYSIPSKNGPIKVDVSWTEVNGLKVYLINGEPIHAGEAVYVNNPAILGERFVFFSVACLYLPKALNWSIDLLHAHDWHTGVAVHQLQALAKSEDSLINVRSMLTIHNMPFMGAGSENALREFLIDPADNPAMPAWARTLPLPMGINAADSVVAVSSGYAREILTPGFGCDLQDFLKAKSEKITGIVNGIDYSLWDPATDTEVFERYTFGTIMNRQKNKTAIQKELGLKVDPEIPLLSLIGRLDRQKGIDIVIDSMKDLAQLDWQLIVLAFGEDKTLEADLLKLAGDLPGKVCFKEEMNLALSRRIYSSADILLMPSRYEPCGLAQMIAMRYGCIPIATATGGLKDTIIDYKHDPDSATGFLAEVPNFQAFSDRIRVALDVFQNKKAWLQMQENGMKTDFSWQKPAREYLDIYDHLMR